jgi:xanthine dehydrogenase YagR molybdenum-binding subunit
VWLSTQAVSHLAHRIASRWNLSRDRVRVYAAHIGGGFGGKLAVTSEVVAAVELARATRAPVRVVLSRAEELTDGGSRPGTTTDLAIVASSGGQLRAITIDAYGDGGVSIGSTVAGLTRLLYGRAPRSLRDFDVVTNAPPGTPFRGPGGPPLFWALEQGVDQMAHQLGTDPIALRRRWDGNPKRARLYDWAQGLPAWKDRQRAGTAAGRFRRGIGVAAGSWFYFVDSDTEVELTVRDGRVLARTATQDIGTGSRTVLTGAVAHGLGVPRQLVVAQIGDSAAPYGPTSSGSSTTTSVAPAAALAAERLKAKLGAAGAQLGDAAAEELSAKASRPKDARRYLTHYHHLTLGRGMSGSVHVAEVEVDTLLGHTQVLRVWAGIAVGKIWEPQLARSQCEGGIVQGVSFALYEQRLLDPVTGVVLTSNLEDYRIAGIADCPGIEIHFDEHGWEHVAGGGVGLGEISTLAVAAAVANAVFNATGHRPADLPIRPQRLLAGLAGLDGNR